MKNKYIVVILLIGIMFTIIGVMFKIMHWPGAGLMLILGGALKISSILLLIIKLLTNDKYKEFLDK